MKTNGFVSGDPVNSASEKPVKTRSRFPSLSYHLYNTERFGEYNSCFVMDCVEGDDVPIRSGGTVSSYTLKAPLMQSISKKKDFYMVPMEAILPINWQKFYTNPTIGDDVPDDCGTGVEDFWSYAYQLFSACFSQCATLIADNNATTPDVLTAIIRTLVIGEYFYSSGSLVKSLGASGDRFAKFRYSGGAYSFDTWVDRVIQAFSSGADYFIVNHDGISYYVILDPASSNELRTSSAVISLRTALQMFRDDLTTTVTSTHNSTTLKNLVKDFFDSSVWAPQVVNPEIPYDLRRLWAYQLVCSHFYSNDHIDYVYSADLFRSLISYCVYQQADASYTPQVFTVNGIKYEYDGMSAHCFASQVAYFLSDISDILVVHYSGTSNGAVRRKCVLGYFSNLFAYRRSLRYVDYFTGSRARPLAVGSVDVAVNSNLVNVVDISRNIQRQRFFNAVNRFGRRFEEYIKGLSGIVPDTDYHNPLYLAHVSDTVYGVEVENTGAAQQSSANSITSRFQTNGSRYQFEFKVDRPCVVIGLSYYDMPRAYTTATERQLFYLNRFDMFNPYMQFIGDQSVGFAELGASYVYASNPTFGYQLRHMEYKQRYDQAAGGFIESLPGFLFTDREFGSLGNQFVNPSFIRSFNAELDSFYVALTGYSLGHYFHFIVDNDNNCDASRPMAFAPSIL